MGPYCDFCQLRCFVPFPDNTPLNILLVHGLYTSLIATCPEGQKFEKEKVGFCYDDIRVFNRRKDMKMRFRLQVQGTDYGANFEATDEIQLSLTIRGGLRRLDGLGYNKYGVGKADLIVAPHFGQSGGRSFKLESFPISVAQEQNFEQLVTSCWKAAKELEKVDPLLAEYREKALTDVYSDIR
jgi:hypothetical protein